MQDVILLDEIEKYSRHIDSEVVSYIRERQVETYESFDGYTLVAFDWYDLRDNAAAPVQLLIYADKEDLFYICENESSYCLAKHLFRSAESNEEALYLFMRAMFKGGSDTLKALETRIFEIDDDISGGTGEELAAEIRELRTSVHRANKFYEQMNFIMEELCDNDNDLISEKTLRYYENIKNLSVRLLSLSSQLRQFAAQLRESYRAQIGIEQNNIMKVFTIVTSIFLPLTLIVGWYGMNLKIPEFGWAYGYPFVAGICVLTVLIWFALLKRKKWF